MFVISSLERERVGEKDRIFCRNVFKYLTREISLRTWFSHWTFPPKTLRVLSVNRGVRLDLSSDVTQLPSLWRVKIALSHSFSPSTLSRSVFRAKPRDHALLRSLHLIQSAWSIRIFHYQRIKAFPGRFPCSPTADPVLSSFVTQINNRCDLWLSFGIFIRGSTRARKR